MVHDPATPEQERVSDALHDHWVDERAPERLRPYLRLSRIERPIGIWLLLLPCFWGIALGALWGGGLRWYDLYLAIAVTIGAILMRGAGCTWNDYTDRDIDGKVARTANRPLATGAVSPEQALIWMGLQALLAFVLLLTFNGLAILLGILALVPVLVYPFAKRFTWWPQAFLGIAFNWGALLGFVAHTGVLAWPAVALYGAGIAWTLFYDTIYAHQDVEDDALIGVKSTARLFGQDSAIWLRRFAMVSTGLMGIACLGASYGLSFVAMTMAMAAPWAMAWHLGWQLSRFEAGNGPVLLRLFRANRDAGLIPLIFLLIALLP